MTLLEQELTNLPNQTLRRMAAGTDAPTIAAAAQAELDSRPSAREGEDAEAWIRRTFPQRPNPFV